jgi:hypothetical protein
METKAQGSIEQSSVATLTAATDFAVEQSPEVERHAKSEPKQHSCWEGSNEAGINGERATAVATRSGCREGKSFGGCKRHWGRLGSEHSSSEGCERARRKRGEPHGR